MLFLPIMGSAVR